MYIKFQICDLDGGGLPSELDRITAIDIFKTLGEEVGTMTP